MLKIERAQLEDVQKITQIKTRAFNKENNVHFGRDGGPPGYNQESSQISLIHNYLAYKILNEDSLIGCFFLVPEENNIMHLEDFCLDPIYQDKGYGYEILKLIEKMHPDINCWKLSTLKVSLGNQYLYEKFGFIKDSEGDELYEYKKIIP